MKSFHVQPEHLTVKKKVMTSKEIFLHYLLEKYFERDISNVFKEGGGKINCQKVHKYKKIEKHKATQKLYKLCIL